MTRRSVPVRALASAAALAVLVTGCSSSGSGKKGSSAPAPSTPATSSAISSSSAPAKPAAPQNVLRGGPYSANPVIAVKIDDTGNGRPQRNIDKADVVYIEEVEGGLTRLAAVFHTYLPTVEAVRSTRAADPELLAQYGPIAYVASGGASNPLAVLDKSPLKADINDRGGPGFERDGSRVAPYNLTANLAYIAKKLKSPKPRDVGFRWAYTTTQTAGAPAGLAVRTRVGATDVQFSWNATLKKYVRVIDGTRQRTAAGALIATPNVIVQFCDVEPYLADRDVNGNPNAYTHTVGSGRAVLFRDGKMIAGTWSRKTATAGTTFVDAKGSPFLLTPGGVWVVLVHRNAPLSA